MQNMMKLFERNRQRIRPKLYGEHPVVDLSLRGESAWFSKHDHLLGFHSFRHPYHPSAGFAIVEASHFYFAVKRFEDSGGKRLCASLVSLPGATDSYERPFLSSGTEQIESENEQNKQNNVHTICVSLH